MRIALLRAGAFLVNCGVVAGVGWLCGLSAPALAAACAVFFGVSWWACGLTPASSPAPPEWGALAEGIADRMGAPRPRSVAAPAR